MPVVDVSGNNAGSAYLWALLVSDFDHRADLGIDFSRPTGSAEYAVVAHAGLQVVAFLTDTQSGAQIERGHGLADGADVVAFALDG